MNLFSNIDPCPKDDPEHDKYHRRSKRLQRLGRVMAWTSLPLGAVVVITVPYALWTADWSALSRAAAVAFVTAVCVAGTRATAQVDQYLHRLELIRLVRENTSVSAAAERLLRSQYDDRDEHPGGYA